MLGSANTVKGCDIKAVDGAMGKVGDFYFDDGSWQIRYLVVDVGSWLKRHQVLLIPDVVTAVDPEAGIIDVALSKEEVANSPDALEQQPVSRQIETALHRHYDWTPYWDVDPLGATSLGHGAVGVVRPGEGVQANGDIAYDANSLAVPEDGHEPKDEALEVVADRPLRPSGRLRSTSEVRGYHIEALDGEIGHVSDFFLNSKLDRIAYLIVDTSNWLSGKKVVIPPTLIHAIHWDGSRVTVALTKEEVQQAPEYVADSFPFIDSGFENDLQDYYTRRTYYHAG